MKSIFTALAPNTQIDDAKLALKQLFLPWRWKRGQSKKELYMKLRDYLNVGHVYLFESGRSALYAILKCLDLEPGDEVLLQAFTCVAVPNSIIWAKARPVYVDCDERFTMSVDDLKKKITPKCKAVIVQHTFGIEADINAILEIARKNSLYVIEDCAHSLGLIKPKGDVSFYSFGRDKIISSTFGGATATDNELIGKRLEAFQAGMMFPIRPWIFKQLWYPAVMYFVKKTYDIFCGKLLLAFLRTFNLLSKPVYPEEKVAKQPPFVPRCLPNVLALLALHQFEKLDSFNGHRKEIAAIYAKELKGVGVLRFSILAREANKILEEGRRARIFLGDWYSTPIAPRGVLYDAVGYTPKSCPMAEKIGKEVINLPTDINITKEDAHRIIRFVKKYLP